MELATLEPPARVDAVVLAGSVNRIRLFPGNLPGYKALVEMLGRPLIAYVLDALSACAEVDRILVVGPPEVGSYASRWPQVTAIPEQETLIENAWAGLRAARTDRVLFCNPDQPMLRTEMVDDFLGRAHECEADVVSSWVRWESMGPLHEQQASHKVAYFGDGIYAHGNLFLVRSDFPDLAEVRARMDALYHARKNTVRFAWALGPALFGRFVLALLTRHLPPLDETLRIAGRHFGLRIDGVVSPYPEIALDVDEPEDYAAAVRFLTRGRHSPDEPPQAQPLEPVVSPETRKGGALARSA